MYPGLFLELPQRQENAPLFRVLGRGLCLCLPRHRLSSSLCPPAARRASLRTTPDTDSPWPRAALLPRETAHVSRSSPPNARADLDPAAPASAPQVWVEGAEQRRPPASPAPAPPPPPRRCVRAAAPMSHTLAGGAPSLRAAPPPPPLHPHCAACGLGASLECPHRLPLSARRCGHGRSSSVASISARHRARAAPCRATPAPGLRACAARSALSAVRRPPPHPRFLPPLIGLPPSDQVPSLRCASLFISI